MGVPSFFRWLSEKFPKMMSDMLEKRMSVVNGVGIPVDLTQPNPNGVEWDNLYIDMNGLIHPCSHPEDGGSAPITEADMYVRVTKYIDRLFTAVRPRRLLYLAIDGIAPRAKMNQQRSRRFRAAEEANEKKKVAADILAELKSLGADIQDDAADAAADAGAWDSNVITPGTEFMTRLSQYLWFYVLDRINSHAAWRNIKVIISDASEPGEGEHKIMKFIRAQRSQPGYDPNQRHILHGLDADLIMLALATHEVHFTILREQVLFGRQGRDKPDVSQAQRLLDAQSNGEGFAASTINPADEWIFAKPLVKLNVSVLREYLSGEFAPLQRVLPFRFDFERTVDDFVFLCFFVGNDFLPHLPSLDIRDGALDYMLILYKDALPSLGDYLTSPGGVVNLRQVDVLLAKLGEVEDVVFRKKKEAEDREDRRRHQQSSAPNARKYGAERAQQERDAMLAFAPTRDALMTLDEARRRKQENDPANPVPITRQAIGASISSSSSSISNSNGSSSSSSVAASAMLVSGDGEQTSVAVALAVTVEKLTREANLSAADQLRSSLRKRALPAPEAGAANEVKDVASEAGGGMAVDAKAAADESSGEAEADADAEAAKAREGQEDASPQNTGGRIKKKMRGDGTEAETEAEAAGAGGLEWTADYDLSIEVKGPGADTAAMDQSTTQATAAVAEATIEEAEEAEEREEDLPPADDAADEAEWVDATVQSELQVAEAAAAKAMKAGHARHELTVRLRKRTDDSLEEMKKKAMVDEVKLHESGWKDRYYQARYKKEDVELGGGLRHMCHTYIQGLCWVFSYYYRGCPSWSWYFPFHYAPFASDLRNIDSYPIDFDQAQPFRPIEQLLAVLPKESAHALPEPCRWLMTSKDSPIADLYVGDVALDPNGKALPWLWILLLPFIKESRIQDAYNYCKDRLSLEDRRRNAFGRPLIFLARQHPLVAAVAGRLHYARGHETDEEVVRALTATGAGASAAASEGHDKAATAKEGAGCNFDAQAGAGICGLLSEPPPQYYAEVGGRVPGPGEPAGHFKDIASNQVRTQ